MCRPFYDQQRYIYHLLQTASASLRASSPSDADRPEIPGSSLPFSSSQIPQTIIPLPIPGDRGPNVSSPAAGTDATEPSTASPIASSLPPRGQRQHQFPLGTRTPHPPRLPFDFHLGSAARRAFAHQAKPVYCTSHLVPRTCHCCQTYMVHGTPADCLSWQESCPGRILSPFVSRDAIKLLAVVGQLRYSSTAVLVMSQQVRGAAPSTCSTRIVSLKIHCAAAAAASSSSSQSPSECSPVPL
jgi:hypothetical protein